MVNDNPDERNLPVTTEQPSGKRDVSDAWKEVGEQFQQLGTKLADALRRSWHSSYIQHESEETMRRLRDDLRSAADRVDQVIKQAKHETESERVSTLKATRQTSEQSVEEARMLTAATLRKLNKQLDQLVHRLETDYADSERERDESREN